MGLSEEIGIELKKRGQELSIAESCTGGGISAAITAVPGSSEYFNLGMVTYSNDSKEALLGVPKIVFEKAGAVSKDCAIAMAVGLARSTGADWCLSVTGIAGPSGGSAEKPIGLVHFALAGPDGVRHLEKRFGDSGREKVRDLAIASALQLISDALLGKLKPNDGA